MNSNYGSSRSGSLGFHQVQRPETKLRLRVDPKVVLQGKLLELNQFELETAIETELQENPALMRHDEAEPITNEEVLKKVAPQELAPSGDWYEGRRSLPSDDPTGWLELTTSQISLTEHLMADLPSRVPNELQTVAVYAVHSLDDRGYLELSAAELSNETGCSFDDAELVIASLKECEPAGIGASCLQECLLLQLRENDTVSNAARQILAEGWDDFVAGKLTRLARKFSLALPLVKKACQFVRELSPYPADSFEVGRGTAAAVSPAVADLAVKREESGWVISVKGVTAECLGIEPYYRRRLAEIEGQNKRSANADPEESRHLRHFVNRAKDFIEGVEVRNKTVFRIGEYLAYEQAGFLSTGSYRFLRNLTRSKMAKDLKLHESTVSRATAEKYLQLPTGEVVPFEVFFKPALRVQKLIEEILMSENPANPLSDEMIGKRLAEAGVVVARRTVHKYRDRAKLSSSRRRRAA